MKIPFKLDERNLDIWRRILSVLHAFTVAALTVMFFYRLNVSGQTFEENWDIGCLMMLNGLFLIAAVLYFGGVNFERIRIKWVVAVYLIYLVVMFLFMSFVETIVYDAPFDFYLIASRMPIIAIACAVVVSVFAFLGYMGRRKVAKDLE